MIINVVSLSNNGDIQAISSNVPIGFLELNRQLPPNLNKINSSWYFEETKNQNFKYYFRRYNPNVRSKVSIVIQNDITSIDLQTVSEYFFMSYDI